MEMIGEGSARRIPPARRTLHEQKINFGGQRGRATHRENVGPAALGLPGRINHPSGAKECRRVVGDGRRFILCRRRFGNRNFRALGPAATFESSNNSSP
jgi:hypothetical protein